MEEDFTAALSDCPKLFLSLFGNREQKPQIGNTNWKKGKQNIIMRISPLSIDFSIIGDNWIVLLVQLIIIL